MGRADRWSHWLHTDQGPLKGHELACIQGGVNVFPTGPDDGCLSVLSGSHKLHRELFEAFPHLGGRKDFIRISGPGFDLIDWFRERGCDWWNITCPAGSIVLWDSRTQHMVSRHLFGQLGSAARLTSRHLLA
jgi:ectoine hydroxylase-related dioxygenase (phytanoyl-CoA dioxygenase family)